MDFRHTDLRQEFIDALEYSNDMFTQHLSPTFKDKLLQSLRGRDYDFLNKLLDEIEYIQHNLAPTGDVLELEQALEEAKELENIKKRLGIEGLRCYCDDIYSSDPILFLTEQEATIIDKHPKQFKELTKPSEIELIGESYQHTLKLMCTGTVYSHLHDLKHDWLAYKLSGLNNEGI